MYSTAEQKKSFKHYEKLLPELREMIVDEMNPDDRCRFSQCSKLSHTEATSSKKYIYKLGILFRSENIIEIAVSHNVCNPYKEDYKLKFNKGKDIMLMKCMKKGKKLWSVELSKSTDLIQMALQRFKELLRLYQDKIKVLRIQYLPCAGGTDFDLGISSLRNLKILSIDGDFDRLEFVSKIRRPLKCLSVYNNSHTHLLKEMIYQVQDGLYMPDLGLNNEQFSRLEASDIFINMGEVTVEHVFNYIRSWQNGTIGRKMKMVHFYCPSPLFNVHQLFSLFGYEDQNVGANSYYRMKLTQFNNPGKEATFVGHQFDEVSVRFND